MINFIHDEVIVELRDDRNLQANIKRINDLMIMGMQQVITHVPIKVEGALMHKWSKEAKEARDSDGNLLPWEDVQSVSKKQEAGK